MKRIIILISILFLTLSLDAQIFYVSTRGNDSNAGLDSSSTGAWATWQKAFITAESDDTVYFMDDIWKPTVKANGNSILYISPRTSVGHNGLPGHPINFFNYPGATPILDCSLIGKDSTGAFNTGLQIYDMHWVNWRGLTIRNVWQYGHHVECFGIVGWPISNMTFDRMVVHGIAGNAIRTVTDANLLPESLRITYPFGWDGSGYIPYDTTRFLNCDTYNNYDTLNAGGSPGNAADGFKTYSDEGIGEYWIYSGCRAWNCSDDGFDLSNTSFVLVENCWSFSNGFIGAPDGDGFKTGAMKDSVSYPARIIKNCISAFNSGICYYDVDYEPYYITNARYYNNVAYKSKTAFQGQTYNPTKPWALTWYKNNLAYEISGKQDGYTIINTLGFNADYNEDHNTWDKTAGNVFPYNVWSDTVTVTNTDFVMIDSATVMSQLTAARQSDGRLPVLTAFRLAGSSDLIGAGTNVGMSATPDIGIDWAYYDATYGVGNEEPPASYVEPTIYSDNATSVKSILATLGGNVTSDGGATVTARGIVWGTSVNPTLSNNVISTTGTTGSYSLTITGLTGNTVYHVRSYATNSVGTSYGADVSFTTPPYTTGVSGVKVGVYNGKIGVIK